VGLAAHRNLRQVRDAQHLEDPAERLQALPHDVGHTSADACVHLVEDQRLARRIGRRQRLEREHDPR